MSGNALRKLDDSRPKAEVCGLPGVAFEQDGILFTSAGVEARPEDYQKPTEEVALPDNPDDPMIGVVVVVDSGEDQPEMIEEGNEPAQAGDGFDKMHHMQLKQLLKTYGVEWTGREDAIALLRGQKKTA